MYSPRHRLRFFREGGPRVLGSLHFDLGRIRCPAGQASRHFNLYPLAILPGRESAKCSCGGTIERKSATRSLAGLGCAKRRSPRRAPCYVRCVAPAPSGSAREGGSAGGGIKYSGCKCANSYGRDSAHANMSNTNQIELMLGSIPVLLNAASSGGSGCACS